MSARSAHPRTSRVLACLLAAALAVAPCVAAKDKPGRKRGKASPEQSTSPPPLSSAGCKEPAPVDAELAAGLAAHARGNWQESSTHLQAWAATPDAERDPAAARGLYALAFAQRQLRAQAAAQATSDRALPLLQARVAQSPTLEGYYYLQGLHQARGDAAAQLTVIAEALRQVESGAICAARDPDDSFRLARLYEFAGNSARQLELLAEASAGYARADPASPATYRALAEKGLGDAAAAAGDPVAAALHLRLAADLDPTIPGVHRGLGVALLKQGQVSEAIAYWVGHWQFERQNGNELMYVVPVLQRLVAHRARFGAEHAIADLPGYTVPALEQNAIVEAKAMAELLAQRAEAEHAGQPVPPEAATGVDVADYRMVQFLAEYVLRGQDLQEFAVQNGLIAAIHGRGLPQQ
jgi:tetratricopeptide (TPR) repeat protein